MKKTITSMNEYTSSSNNEYNRKPPSPSPRRRTPLSSSPAPPRRTSPSPGPAARRTSPPNFRGASPPRKRSPSPKMDSYNQAGQGYFTKYNYSSSASHHNTSSHSFPTCPSPSPATKSLQTPPKRVDDLMSELSEFDPSITHTTFQEPSRSQVNTNAAKYNFDHHEEIDTRHHREPSPVKPVKQTSQPGPAVYYPPGELFSSTRMDTSASEMSQPVNTTLDTSASSRGKAKVRAEYGYKEKGRYSEGENKQGAAVVPICLPLCCAAPCVIL